MSDISINDLQTAYGSPDTWYMRLLSPDGEVLHQYDGKEWREWLHCYSWEMLFEVLLGAWNCLDKGGGIQLYFTLNDTTGTRTAERGAGMQVVHAELIKRTAEQFTLEQFFFHTAHAFKVTINDAPNLLPDWVPLKAQLHVQPAPLGWEDLL